MAGLLMEQAKTDRIGRYPKHPFQVQGVPFTCIPMMMAPVLPGETLKNIFMESRVITSPILNPIIGWKKHYYFFYVRITDLLTEAIRDMFVDPTNTDLLATMGLAVNSAGTYEAKGGMDYTFRCMKAVMEHWFRDEGQAWNHAYCNLTDLPFVQIKDVGFLDSLTDKDAMPEGAAIAGATDAGDLDRLLDAFEMLRDLGLRNMTYEDFLRSYGIKVPSKDEQKPEMLCHFSDFQYPSNTIDPTSGSPTSAVSWVFKNGNRDPKFFTEPGFIFGMTVTRPKTYYSGLAGSMANFMGRAWDWLPNYLAAMPETSLKQFAADTGPLGDRTSSTDAYWLDMRDLLLYGDQFQNVHGFDPAVPNVGANHMLALPTGNNHQAKDITDAMSVSFFVDDENILNQLVKEDGYVSLHIMGAQVDHTPGNFAQA